VRTPSAGVYPPEIDASNLIARLGYIAECWASSRGPWAAEFAATTREAATELDVYRRFYDPITSIDENEPA
jgi:hypothetical protein